MSSYGQNFSFRVPPRADQRKGRFTAPDDADLPIGAPVKADGTTYDALNSLPVQLASADDSPIPGLSGIVVFEHAPAAFAGDDPALTTYSDKVSVPRGKQCQVVSGKGIKVCFRNTSDRTFLNTRDYDGVTFVAGVGATPTVAVGDYLTPGAGNGTSGYWKETSDVADAWLVVTKVDATRHEVEAELLF